MKANKCFCGFIFDSSHSSLHGLIVHHRNNKVRQNKYRPFLNMRSCLYLWTCETSSVVTQVLFQFKVHIQPSTVKIPGCVLAPPLLSRMHQEVTCANLRQPGIPECISHQSVSINGGGGKTIHFSNITVIVS